MLVEHSCTAHSGRETHWRAAGAKTIHSPSRCCRNLFRLLLTAFQLHPFQLRPNRHCRSLPGLPAPERLVANAPPGSGPGFFPTKHRPVSRPIRSAVKCSAPPTRLRFVNPSAATRRTAPPISTGCSYCAIASHAETNKAAGYPAALFVMHITSTCRRHQIAMASGRRRTLLKSRTWR